MKTQITQTEFWSDDSPECVDAGMYANFHLSRIPTGVLTLFVEDRPANQQASPAAGSAILMSDGCGPTRLELFARFDHESQSWKTRQACFDLCESSDGSFAAWPRAGISWNGACFHLPEWEQIIVESGCSFMPTPTAGTPPKNGLRWDDNGGSYARRMLLKFMSLEETRQGRNPEYLEWQMGFPIKFTETEPSETVAIHESPTGSPAAS